MKGDGGKGVTKERVDGRERSRANIVHGGAVRLSKSASMRVTVKRSKQKCIPINQKRFRRCTDSGNRSDGSAAAAAEEKCAKTLENASRCRLTIDSRTDSG